MIPSMGISVLLLSMLAACAATGSNLALTRTPVPTPTALPPLLIVTLGDSLTSGDKDAEPGGGWPRRLRSMIAAQRADSHLVNLAQPGWTSRDMLQGVGDAPNQIDQAVKVLREARGDKIATVWIGTNDLFYLYEFGDPTSADEAREADRFEHDLAELLDRLRAAGAQVFIALLHDPSQGAVQTSGVFMSTTGEEWARMSRQAQRYNEIIRNMAAKYVATLVDIPATNIFTTAASMYEDGIHPNARGYDELAEMWWKALQDTKAR